MLRHTFLHLPGLGPSTERRLWAAGIRDWDAFLDADTPPLASAKAPMWRNELLESRKRLASGDAERLKVLTEFYFGPEGSEHQGLVKLVNELGDIDARELSTFPLGANGINVREVMYAIYDERYWGFAEAARQRYARLDGPKAEACTKCGQYRT